MGDRIFVARFPSGFMFGRRNHWCRVIVVSREWEWGTRLGGSVRLFGFIRTGRA